ncbi:purine-binding chemotaxis protein CheW [Wenzhouxiangella sp. AB-CW3]|uniref:chemotaxis protein CheW n=1 Tax=Wenzhouxiangella sp. AB-CW3 TaxID=2771012 RepID=UPI00168C09A0|nr:chemotaxis protein CheW [Wenzhouxiangella sp. AB-CW3]QOC21180.1 purine-binding chemotaxis protein CheW [Wenzhouxiangella sp. AB-CW3]
MNAKAKTQADDMVRADWDEWLQFGLDGQQYGLNVLQVQEILCGARITPVPGAPAFVLGLINLRGSIVTVVDARQRLGLVPRPARETDWIIILDVQDQSVGLLVDEVSEVMVLDPDRIEAMRGNDTGEDSRHVQGVIQTPAGMLILLDIESLVGLKELRYEQAAAAG